MEVGSFAPLWYPRIAENYFDFKNGNNNMGGSLFYDTTTTCIDLPKNFSYSSLDNNYDLNSGRYYYYISGIVTNTESSNPYIYTDDSRQWFLSSYLNGDRNEGLYAYFPTNLEFMIDRLSPHPQTKLPRMEIFTCAKLRVIFDLKAFEEREANIEYCFFDPIIKGPRHMLKCNEEYGRLTYNPSIGKKSKEFYIDWYYNFAERHTIGGKIGLENVYFNSHDAALRSSEGYTGITVYVDWIKKVSDDSPFWMRMNPNMHENGVPDKDVPLFIGKWPYKEGGVIYYEDVSNLYYYDVDYRYPLTIRVFFEPGTAGPPCTLSPDYCDPSFINSIGGGDDNEEYEETPFYAKGQTTHGVYVRSGPGTNYPIVSSYRSGQVFSIKAIVYRKKPPGEGQTWYRSYDGYILGNYVTIIELA